MLVKAMRFFYPHTTFLIRSMLVNPHGFHWSKYVDQDFHRRVYRRLNVFISVCTLLSVFKRIYQRLYTFYRRLQVFISA